MAGDELSLAELDRLEAESELREIREALVFGDIELAQDLAQTLMDRLQFPGFTLAVLSPADWALVVRLVGGTISYDGEA